MVQKYKYWRKKRKEASKWGFASWDSETRARRRSGSKRCPHSATFFSPRKNKKTQRGAVVDWRGVLILVVHGAKKTKWRSASVFHFCTSKASKMSRRGASKRCATTTHTAIYVFAYCYRCDLILLCIPLLHMYVYTHTYIYILIYIYNKCIKKGIELRGNSSDFRLWLFDIHIYIHI